MPQDDDEGEPGVSFFRTYVGGDNAGLRNLTLPRTFFGQSEIRDVDFSNTDFTESNLCWNDFIDANFTDRYWRGATCACR
jgi:BTB/POZ domain-containing protein KCTD9